MLRKKWVHLLLLLCGLWVHLLLLLLLPVCLQDIGT